MTPIEQQIEQLVDAILADYGQGRDIDKMYGLRRPDKDAVIDIIEKLRRIVFPGYFKDKTYRMYNPPFSDNYHGIGIVPDVEVELDEALLTKNVYKITDEEDNQLAAAAKTFYE